MIVFNNITVYSFSISFQRKSTFVKKRVNTIQVTEKIAPINSTASRAYVVNRRASVRVSGSSDAAEPVGVTSRLEARPVRECIPSTSMRQMTRPSSSSNCCFSFIIGDTLTQSYRWQATVCPGSTSRVTGFSILHISMHSQQRV